MIKKLLRKVNQKFQEILLSPEVYLAKRFKKRTGRELNLKKPLSFSEKLQWLKLNEFKPIMTNMVDKVEVKHLVEKKIGNSHVIPTLNVYERASDIDYAYLPEEFILKANHGSGWNFLVLDKLKSPQEKAIKYFAHWLRKSYYPGSKEIPYKFVKPKVIAEPLLRDDGGELPRDYKIFCFDGVPTFIQVDIDRFTKHTRAIYDADWKKQAYSIGYEIFPGEIERPTCLKELLELSKVLSANWRFVRVDFYICNNKIYFGEYTFFPGGGMEQFTDFNADLTWGSKIKLDNN